MKRNRPKITKPIDAIAYSGQVAYNRHGGYFVPNSSAHTPCAQKILKGGVYEEETIDFICRNAHDGDIIHAGTYFGDFLPALCRSTVGDRKVYAFEPSSNNFACAKITCAINKLERTIDLRHAALGAIDGEVSIVVSDEHGRDCGGMSKVAYGLHVSLPITERVNLLRLDTALPDNCRPSIIHLDVEGYELEVLMGGIKTIQKHSPVLVMEDNDEAANTLWFDNCILGIGYSLVGAVGRNKIYQKQK